MSKLPKGILITGVFGTGKTTLVKEIAAWAIGQGLAVKVALEVSRTSPFPLNRDQTDLGTTWLLLRQLLTESEKSIGSPEIFVADRGVIDILAHLRETEARSGRPSVLLSMYHEAMRASVNSYNIIFRTHPSELYPPEADGIRSTSLRYQKKMDAFHDEAIQALGAKCISLPNGLDERIKKVAAYLDGLAKM